MTNVASLPTRLNEKMTAFILLGAEAHIDDAPARDLRFIAGAKDAGKKVHAHELPSIHDRAAVFALLPESSGKSVLVACWARETEVTQDERIVTVTPVDMSEVKLENPHFQELVAAKKAYWNVKYGRIALAGAFFAFLALELLGGLGLAAVVGIGTSNLKIVFGLLPGSILTAVLVAYLVRTGIRNVLWNWEKTAEGRVIKAVEFVPA